MGGSSKHPPSAMDYVNWLCSMFEMSGSNNSINIIDISSKPLPAMEFLTIQNTLRGMILGRRPGDNRCLYKRFAMLQKIVLDVYGNDKHRKPICAKDFR